MLKMVDGTGIIGVDMICPLGVSTPQPPNYDRVELEGTGVLVLPNSLDAPLERLELGGKTGQVRTTGAQLITLANRTDVGDTELGGKKWLTKISEQAYSVYNNYQKSTVEFMGNNSFKLSHNTGASSTNGNGLELPVKIKPDTDYTLSYTSSISEVLVYFIQMDSGCNKLKETSSRNKKHTFHSEANAEWVILKFASVLNNSYVVSNIQFEKGTVATSFEPYTGGKPSPSLEYPQEIKSVGKYNEITGKYEVDVKVTGKNLLDIEKVKGELPIYVGKGARVSVSCKKLSTGLGFYALLSKSKGSPSNPYSWVYHSDSTNLIIDKVTFTAEADVIYFNFTSNKKQLLANLADSLQIEISDSPTEYQPYKEQILTLTSDRPITKWDKLVEQDGQIGWLYQSKIASLTGKEEWKSSLNAFYTTAYNFMKNNEAKCSHYVLGGITNQEKNNIFSIGDGAYANSLWVRDTSFGTVQDFKAHLSDLIKKGTPITVVSSAAETEFVPLPQSEQNAIRALKTYYPTTVITVDGGELDPDIKVTYRKEI